MVHKETNETSLALRKVQLIGIDAAELDQAPWGIEARDVLRGLVDGKTVRLETDITIRDQYRRLLAYVYV